MRPLYIASKLLAARDLNDEQADLLRHVRRHDRFAHGYGIVCGLRIYAAPDRLHPWTVGVCPGYAIDPCGDEIEVPCQVLVDVRDFFWSRPYINGAGSREAFVGLRFSGTGAEADSSACTCGCTSSHEASTRIEDGYAVEILWSSAERGVPEIDLCKPGPVACPNRPAGRHVMLAKIHLPLLETTFLTDVDIVSL
jgi:hypothetical protein